MNKTKIDRLEEAISSYTPGGKLPDIGAGRDDLNWINKLFIKLLDYLGPIGFDSEPVSLAVALIYILISILVIYLCYRCYKMYRLYQVEKSFFFKSATKNEDIEDPLDQLYLQLNEAIEANDYARAARVEWTIFLLESNHSLGTTPQELFSDSIGKNEIRKMYGLMFKESSDAEKLSTQFKQFKEFLLKNSTSELEG